MPDQQSVSPPPSAAASAGCTADEVIKMFAELGLSVTDDSQRIEAEVIRRRARYLQQKNSPDPKLRFEADTWFKNVVALQQEKDRAKLLQVVYERFVDLANASLSAVPSAGPVTITPELKNNLRTLALKCQIDDELADKFLTNYLDYFKTRNLPAPRQANRPSRAFLVAAWLSPVAAVACLFSVIWAAIAVSPSPTVLAPAPAPTASTRQTRQATETSSTSWPDPTVAAIFGPASGQLVSIDDGKVPMRYSGVSLRNFTAESVFYSPADPKGWDFGFSFRVSPQKWLYLIISSDRKWYLKMQDGTDRTLINQGDVPALDDGEGAANILKLSALDDHGCFSINGEFVADLDLSALDKAGDLAVGSSYFIEHDAPGVATAYENFVVSRSETMDCSVALAPTAGARQTPQVTESSPTPQPDAAAAIFGPASGQLVVVDSNIIPWRYSGVSLRNFTAESVFYSPADPKGWDFGFSFRASSRKCLFLVISSDRKWYLYMQDGTAQTLISQGDVPVLDSGEGAANILKLSALDDHGCFSINGEFVADLDLSALDKAGDLAVGGSYLVGHNVLSTTTAYENFVVSRSETMDCSVALAPTAGARQTPQVTESSPTPQPDAAAAIFGPASGQLVVSKDGTVPMGYSGVSLRNFTAKSVFYSPADPKGWDFGFSFRVSPQEWLYLVISSDRKWYLYMQDGTVQTSISQGIVPTLDSGEGAANILKLSALDDHGCFSINGKFVADLDLSALNKAGNLAVGGSYLTEHNALGATTTYKNFVVYRSEAIDCP